MTEFKQKKWLFAVALTSMLISFTHSSIASGFDRHQSHNFYHSSSVKQLRHDYAAIQVSRNGGKVRSRSDVVSEVKNKYPNCEILKVKLDERAMVYRVRILTRKGRVSVISVNANK